MPAFFIDGPKCANGIAHCPPAATAPCCFRRFIAPVLRQIGERLMALHARISFDNALALAQASGLACANDPATIEAGLTQAIGSPPTEFEVLNIPTHSTSVFVE